ncbi:MAG: CRISPR-associated endonuclease Cas1, partial [Victivallales bacterium]|nr:CRISPR-associated endonuclease Cas1 [Victivallales bacterium]
MSVVYINEQGAYLRKRSGRFVVTKKDEEIFSIPEAAVDEIVLLGNVQVSTQAISELLQNGVELLFLSRNGKFKGILEPGFNKNVFLRIAQYDASIDSTASLDIARRIVAEKINSEISMLESWTRSGFIETPDNLTNELRRQVANLSTKTDAASLRGCEGVAAKLYFSTFAELAPAPFEWTGRNRRPP